jgi:RNA polymerase sigma factor (sigma-70 family)
MEATAVRPVCLDYVAICKRAIGTLQRRGVCEWVEREELIAEGCLALSAAVPDTEALAVTIARRAMIDTIRRTERRERGRVEVRASCSDCADEASDGDRWDATVHGKQGLQPVNTHPDLWEAMKALPAREYQAVTLFYWGGKTQAQIADAMGVDQATVSRTMASANKFLYSCINGNSHTITNMRGKEAPRTVLSGGTEGA